MSKQTILRHVVALMLIFFAGASAFAQKISVKGNVVDENGQPLPGAGVLVKGTTQGVITDLDGNYQISASAGQTLVFSFIGYSSVEEAVAGRTVINVALQPDANVLEDVVVVGYGTQSRKSLTSSIAKVDGESLFNAPVASVGDALKGKVSGLRVATNNTLPGEAPRMLIRGGSSINRSNDPVVIIDGMKRDMSDINPNDIESMEILKDAASAAIYGSQASNGVILITTKKGSPSKGPQITFDAQFGVESPSRKWDLMDAKEYLEFLRPALVDGYNGAAVLTGANGAGTGNTLSSSIYSTRYLDEGDPVPSGYQWIYDPIDESKVIIFKNYDAQKEWFQNSVWHKEYVGINGGNDQMKYAASISYLKDGGIIPMTDYNSFTMHGNTSFKVTKSLEASTTFDFSRSVKNPLTGNYFNAIGRGLMEAPTYREYDDDGHWLTGGTNVNQQSASFYNAFYDRETDTKKINANINLKWSITKNLKATAQYAIYDNEYRGSYYAYGEVDGTPNYISQTRSTSETRTNTYRQSWQAYLNYNKAFGKHKINATAGYEASAWRYWYLTANGVGSLSDKVPMIQSGDTYTASNNDYSTAMTSYFGRVNYDYAGKYLLSGTVRADGSSLFSKENRWGWFPSGSAAWVISEEPFFSVDKNTVNLLKLRASYGATGNNDVARTTALGAYSVSNLYNGKSVTLPSTMQNTGVKWETTTQLDFGLDANFFKDRIRFVADYYNKVTSDMLFSITLPDTGTFSSVMANVGSARFYGFELELHTANIQKKDMSWTTDITFSYTKNRVLSLPEEYAYDELDIYGNPTGKKAYRIGGYKMTETGYRFGGTAVGESLGTIWGYKIDHIIESEAEADAALYDTQSHGWRRSDHQSITGRKDIGDYEWVNRYGSAKRTNGDEQINAEDMFALGNVMPWGTGGINNTFTYKRWTFNIYMDYALGHSVYNYMKSRLLQNTLGNMNSNMDSKLAADTWTYPGCGAKYARFTPNDADYGNRNFSRCSDFNVERADYLCLRDVSVYYDLPESLVKHVGMKKVSVGVSGNTLYYLTGVSGSINPETGMGTDSSDGFYSAVSTGGSANSSICPTARKVLFNVKVTF